MGPLQCATFYLHYTVRSWIMCSLLITGSYSNWRHSIRYSINLAISIVCKFTRKLFNFVHAIVRMVGKENINISKTNASCGWNYMNIKRNRQHQRKLSAYGSITQMAHIIHIPFAMSYHHTHSNEFNWMLNRAYFIEWISFWLLLSNSVSKRINKHKQIYLPTGISTVLRLRLQLDYGSVSMHKIIDTFNIIDEHLNWLCFDSAIVYL